jgi:predicted transcriptional regulator
MAFGDILKAFNQSGGQPSAMQPMQSPIGMPPIDDKASKNQKLGLLLYAFGGALKGDQNFVQNTLALQEMQEGKAKEKARIETLRKTVTNPEFAAKYPWAKDMYDLAGPDALSPIVSGIASSYKPTTDSVERFSVFSKSAGRPISSVLKTDVKTISEIQADPDLQIVPLSAPATGKSAVSDPLRTITQGGKVIKNVRDSELTPEEITKINQAGQVIQPLGFTEKFESSKDVDFGPVKDKYLATQNLIVKTSELAQKFADEPSSALAVGEMSQFVDGVIQNIDVGGNLLSGAKDTKVYKYIQENSTSVEGKDFTDAIQKASIASGVAQSRIRDLAYLFAAARGQTGRGLSDKDFENALKIVSGGVGVAGRSAVLKDVSNSLREEFYRDINFDIATSENQAYVDRLKGLPELPYYVEAAQQTPPPTTGGPRRIRRQVP